MSNALRPASTLRPLVPQVNVAPGVELRANFFLRPTKADEALTAQRTWEVSEDRPMAPLQRLKDLLVW